MDAHEPRKNHADDDSGQAQVVVLPPNHFVVHTKNMFSKKAGRWTVVWRRVCGNLVHLLSSIPWLMPYLYHKRAGLTASLLPASSTYQNLPATSLPGMLSCCNDPVRKAVYKQFHTCRSWSL